MGLSDGMARISSAFGHSNTGFLSTPKLGNLRMVLTACLISLPGRFRLQISISISSKSISLYYFLTPGISFTKANIAVSIN